jgi:dTMP kinase
MFFVFDGVDGAGKTTQIERFVQWLQSQGKSVVACKDPGSTALGEELRKLLLEKHQIPISMRSEMMMFTTARTQLVEEIVRPALQQGKTVVLDRYILSTVVYQGHAGQLDPQDVWRVNHIATAGLMPEVTFIFDLPPELAFQRLQRRTRNQSHDDLDRMESRGIEYFEKVRAGFLLEAERWPDRVEVIDANRPIDTIEKELQALATRYMQRRSTDKSEHGNFLDP